MKDLIQIKVENDQQLVSARELHKALGFKKKFSGWWEQNQDQFEKGIDFNEVPKGYIVESGNGSLSSPSFYLFSPFLPPFFPSCLISPSSFYLIQFSSSGQSIFWIL